MDESRPQSKRTTVAVTALNSAKSLLERGRAGEASTLLLNVIKQHPEDTGLRQLLGVAQFRLKQFTDAESTFRQVVSRQPDHHQAVYYLGLALERQDRQGEALRMFRAALALRPDFTKAKEKVAEYARPGAGSRTETRPLSALIEDGERTPDKAQDLPGERLYSGRRRLSSFVGHFVILITPLAAMGLFAAARVKWAMGLGVPLIVGVVTFLIVVNLILAYTGTHYEIFQRRIDIRRGGLYSVSESIWHYEILDVTLSRPIVLRLTGDANLTLRTQNGPRSLVGLGPAPLMERLWREIRDAALVERREMKKIWI